MKNKNVVKTLLFMFILTAGSVSVIAQNIDNLLIKAIPKKLFWENKPEKFSLEEDVLTIVAGEKTDMFRDPNVTYNTDNAPKLFFQPDDNFVLTTCIEHAFATKWDGGAIVLKMDSLNWIKFCFEKDYTGANRVVSVVTKNISDDCNSVELSAHKVYFKIAKADQVITLYYSTNGVKWFLIRHLQVDFKASLKLGFMAQSPLGTSCKVRFSQFNYKAIKIKDPYLGE